MRGVKRTMPLLILCKRPGCENVREVRRPYLQRRGGYCSRRCAAIVNQNLGHAAHQKGGRASARRKKLECLKRVKRLTLLEAFRLGYIRGLQSKLRQIRKRYLLIRRA